ncbi:hypothetical protein EVJ50_07290 [Synechococcus sp. RSCCF101]|nr:hypothetical protein EVJ50_07290 [Synechococcus sp. RSCCF101]
MALKRLLRDGSWWRQHAEALSQWQMARGERPAGRSPITLEALRIQARDGAGPGAAASRL